jgi:Flp pilus assembly protein TadD
LVLLSAALNDAGLRDRAETVLRRAWRLKPGDFWTNYELGGILWTGNRDDKPQEAIRFFSAAVAIRPRSPGALSRLGVVLRNQGRIEEAIAEYRAALQFKPDFAEAHSNLGAALINQGKLDEAMAEYREALRLNSDYPEAHSNLGTAFARQGKLEQAIGEYREAVRLKPEYANAHYNLGSALRVKGELEEAIPELREALRIKPDYPAAHNNLGLALASQGMLEEAAAEYRTALQLSPDSAGTQSNLGSALQYQGKLEEAIAAYRAALRLQPNFPEAHSNLGLALRAHGEFAGAIAELRKALELAKGDPSIDDRAGFLKSNPSAAERIALYLTETESLASLAPRLPAVLAGELKPSSGTEAIRFAHLFEDRNLHGASAGLWTEGFALQPELANDMKAQHRYRAARTAALAGCGHGKDNPPLDEPTKARWRRSALDWLKADLAMWSGALQTGGPETRQSVIWTLQRWKADTPLAGLRVPGHLQRLPLDEQKACRALWAEVDALLAKAQGGAKR